MGPTQVIDSVMVGFCRFSMTSAWIGEDAGAAKLIWMAWAESTIATVEIFILNISSRLVDLGLEANYQALEMLS